jgi:hypothetical protein
MCPCAFPPRRAGSWGSRCRWRDKKDPPCPRPKSCTLRRSSIPTDDGDSTPFWRLALTAASSRKGRQPWTLAASMPSLAHCRRPSPAALRCRPCSGRSWDRRSSRHPLEVSPLTARSPGATPVAAMVATVVGTSATRARISPIRITGASQTRKMGQWESRRRMRLYLKAGSCVVMRLPPPPTAVRTLGRPARKRRNAARASACVTGSAPVTGPTRAPSQLSHARERSATKRSAASSKTRPGALLAPMMATPARRTSAMVTATAPTRTSQTGPSAGRARSARMASASPLTRVRTA